MKKLLFAVFALFTLTSCLNSENEIYDVDWNPVCIGFKVLDQDGNDLLDPENPNNYVSGTSITFQNTTYQATTAYYDEYMKETKAYAATMYGLFLAPGSVYIENEVNNLLVFGEIDGALDMNEKLVISWPDGTSDTVEYYCANHMTTPTIACDRTVKLNGVEMESSIFTLVKTVTKEN